MMSMFKQKNELKNFLIEKVTKKQNKKKHFPDGPPCLNTR